ncbi:MAG: hypothetical protein COB65_13975 [Thalassobium sp.]|nr:MAG: hypothetical protein COB65_13975 [Thalassobium sp.]
MQPHYISKIIFLLVFLFSRNVEAQNFSAFYFEANEARKLGEEGKIDSAIKTYENAFKILDYVKVEDLIKVVELAKLNNDEERIKLYSQRIEKQSKATNPELKATIDSLVRLDQKVRNRKSIENARYFWKCNQDSSCNKYSKKYIRAKLLYENWAKTDSSNINCLLKLIEQYGFLGEELVGFQGYIDITLILVHFDTDTSNTILEPILTKALYEGKVLPEDFAYIIDRHLYFSGSPVKYWLFSWSSATKIFQSDAEITKILELRESIGLYGSKLWQEEYKDGHWRIRNDY